MVAEVGVALVFDPAALFPELLLAGVVVWVGVGVTGAGFMAERVDAVCCTSLAPCSDESTVASVAGGVLELCAIGGIARFTPGAVETVVAPEVVIN